MSHNPFNLFKCTYNKVNRVELEWEEINTLAEHHFKVKRLAEVRDTFLFCCFTGYAFVDVDKLSPPGSGYSWYANPAPVNRLLHMKISDSLKQRISL